MQVEITPQKKERKERTNKANWLLNSSDKIAYRLLNDSQYDTFDNILSTHSLLSTIGLASFYLFALSAFIKLTYTVLKYTGVFGKWELAEIEHVDFAGIFCGTLGIVISLIITMYVEYRHDTHDMILDAQTKSLQDSVVKITDMLRMLQIAPQEHLSERLNAIRQIIDITIEDSENKIYILNYNASYGCLQSHNLTMILDDPKEAKTPPKNWKDFHKIHNWFYDLQEGTFQRLLRLKEGKMKLALLRANLTSPLNPTDRYDNQADKYENLLERLLKKRKVCFYDENDTDESHFSAVSKERFKKDIYAVSKNVAGMQDLSQALVKKLVDANKIHINSLIKKNIIPQDEIVYLYHDDFVPFPFQFYLTVPDKPSEKTRQKCLLVFTDLLIAEGRSQTTSFTSDNLSIVQTLKNIHETMSDNYRGSKKLKQGLERLFSCSEKKPVFVLTKTPEPRSDEKTAPAYLADYTAYSDLRELFSYHQITETTIKFNDALSLEKIEQQEGTFIIIGLFGNDLAENLRDDKRSFFNFCRSDIDIDKTIEHDREEITVYLDGHRRLIEKKTGKKGTPFNKPGRHADELALLVKMKIGKSTVIICGGLNGWGTGIIGRYIRENFESVLSKGTEKGLDAQEYAMIFSINLPEKHDNEFDPNLIERGKSSDCIKDIKIFIKA